MIEPTDEMKATFRAAQERRAEELVAEGAPLGAHDILDRGLAAVLAIVERDRPNQYLAAADLLAWLPKLLREAREGRGLSIQAAADEMCLAPSTVHRIESGKGCWASVATRVLFWLGLDHTASTDQDRSS